MSIRSFMGPGSRLVMFSLRALFSLGLFSLSYGSPIQGTRRILEGSLLEGSLYGSLRFLSELSLRFACIQTCTDSTASE